MTSTKPKHRILITVEGGVIQNIENIPPGTVVEVRDFDKDGNREHPSWSEEHQAFVGVWAGPDLPVAPRHDAAAARDQLAAPWTLEFEQDGTEDIAVIRDADGEGLATSRPFWLPEGDDPEPPTLVALRLMQRAPKLMEALVAAENFICGFEGDEMQEGIDGLLKTIRDALAKAQGDSVGGLA